jgi:hypothetical protein
MTKRQRSTLFFALLFLFLLIGPALVFYSQGYRIDFSQRKIIQTGALYFQITPRTASIEVTYQTEKPIKKTTDFLVGTAFIENLLPKRHNIKVEKLGYHSWQKTVEIGERITTDFKNIVLIPKEPEFQLIAQEIEDIFEHSGKIIVKRHQDQWTLSVYGQSPFFSYQEDKDFEISFNSDQALIKTNNQYYLAFINKDQPIVLDLPEKVKKVSLDSKRILYLKENSLFAYDYQNQKTVLLLEKVLDYHERGDNDFFFILENGDVMRNLSAPRKQGKTEKNNPQLFFPNSQELMIRENNSFFFLDQEKTGFQSQYQPITSPDFKKLVYYTDHEIGLFFFDNVFDQPQRKPLDDVFLTRFSEKISDVAWYTPHYLVFTVLNEIKIMEIDDRDNLNIVSLATFSNPKIIFNSSQKRIYVLSENKLLVSKKLVP